MEARMLCLLPRRTGKKGASCETFKTIDSLLPQLPQGGALSVPPDQKSSIIQMRIALSKVTLSEGRDPAVIFSPLTPPKGMKEARLRSSHNLFVSSLSLYVTPTSTRTAAAACLQPTPTSSKPPCASVAGS